MTIRLTPTLRFLRILLLSFGAGTACTNEIAAPLAAAGEENGAATDDLGVERWKQDLRREALAKGISAQTFDSSLQNFAPLGEVVKRDRRQPEFVQTLWTYLERGVSEQRVVKGRELLKQHAALLDQVERRYGVPRSILTAFWGMETNYGAFFGDFPVIDALATLACDARRSAYFRRELLEALAIVEAGHVAAPSMIGSWAGAMGNFQFMPSTFRRYGVDADGDGKIDLWGSLPDALFSAAHYLSAIGWKRGEGWGVEVRLPKGFDLDLASLTQKRPLGEWSRLGVRNADGTALPAKKTPAGLFLPVGVKGPSFLVYDNFHVILSWNRSFSYALAVGLLSDRLQGGRGLHAKPSDPNERPLSIREVASMQENLLRLGYDPGGVDGVVGSKTREAVKKFQKDRRLPPDGYPDGPTLLKIRDAAKADAASEPSLVP